MSTHHLDDDNLFLRCLKDGEIRIRRITNPGEVVGNWEEYKIVYTRSDGVKIYDAEISGLKLRELEVELQKYRMYVNRQGYSYVSIGYGRSGSDLHRVNDFFNWSKYGVVPIITTIWNRCEMNTNAIVINYEKKEKDLADMKMQLEEKDKSHHHLNDALVLKDQDLMEKAKYIVKKDEELRKMAECVEKKIQELNEKERCMALKDQQLKDCKLQLQKRERELSLLFSLCERHLGAEGNFNNCNESTNKGNELFLYKKCLEEKELELRKLSSQLSVEKKRVNDLKFKMKSVASYVNHVNAGTLEEDDHDFPSPSMRGREYVSVKQDLKDGNAKSEIGDINQQ